MQEKGRKTAKRVLAIAGGVLFGVGCFFGGYFTYASKIDDEMKTLLWVKETIQDEYNYEITDEQFYDAVFDGVNSLLDPYSQYLSKEEYAEVLEESTGKWSGMGIQFSTIDETGKPQILAAKILGNSPAERAGIKVGSRLLFYGLSEEEMVAAGDYADFTDFLDLREENESFFLTWQEVQKEETYTVCIAKESFVESYVNYRSNDTAFEYLGQKKTAKGEPLPSLDEDTAYVRLTQFNGGASEEFDGAMSTFKSENKKHLILDLRGNGGGYLSILSDICKYFCKDAKESNPVVATANYRNGRKISYRAEGNVYDSYFERDSEITVLADNGTASASECLIGCMIDYGTISYEDIYLFSRVQEKDGVFSMVAKTYGKGIMQAYFPQKSWKLSPTMKLTTAYIVWPKTGKCIHGIGITPEDGAKEMPYDYFTDREIERVIEEKR